MEIKTVKNILEFPSKTDQDLLFPDLSQVLGCIGSNQLKRASESILLPRSLIFRARLGCVNFDSGFCVPVALRRSL